MQFYWIDLDQEWEEGITDGTFGNNNWTEWDEKSWKIGKDYGRTGHLKNLMILIKNKIYEIILLETCLIIKDRVKTPKITVFPAFLKYCTVMQQ